MDSTLQKYTSDDPNDSRATSSVNRSISRALLVLSGTIDVPFSFVADTAFLPFQAYWYLNPDVEQLNLKEEPEKQRTTEAK